MWPDRVSNLGPLALESVSIPTTLHDQAILPALVEMASDAVPDG